MPLIIYRIWLDTSYSASTTANISLSLPRKSINAQCTFLDATTKIVRLHEQDSLSLIDNGKVLCYA